MSEHLKLNETETIDVAGGFQPLRKGRLGSLLVLTGYSKGLLVLLDKPATILGRAEDSDLVLNDPGVSRQHARFDVNANGGPVLLVDLGSTNGTLLNGEQVRSSILQDGDRIDIGAAVALSFGYRDALEGDIQSQLYKDSIHDGLTGLKNRRYLDERLAQEFRFARRRESVLSVVMLDIDNFKNVNDTRGHAAGDAVLKELAQRVSQLVRGEDVLARYGGEEFALVLRGTDGDGARNLAERIRLSVETQPVTLSHSESLSITASLGVATMGPQPFAMPHALLAAADAALYQAKARGRNRVEWYQPSPGISGDEPQAIPA